MWRGTARSSCPLAAPFEPPFVTVIFGLLTPSKYHSYYNLTEKHLYFCIRLVSGIPFAAPPVGKLRFAPPSTRPWPTWNGILNATQPRPSCPQPSQLFAEHDTLKLAPRLFSPSQLQYDEDCLFLNVYTPDGNSPREGWPVMIWYHPGDFKVGSPNLWDATVFAVKQKVIVVTAAYRLNILGFLTTMDDAAQGNFGLMDQVAVMDWVQEHIVHFNGSKSDVTIWGHSAGGISVSLHMFSTYSKGKFHRAISMSGNALIPGGIRKLTSSVVDELAATFYCDREPSSRLMECLRGATLEALVKKGLEIGDWGPVVDTAFPNVTEPFFPGHPAKLLEEGRIATKVPFMCGFTDMEDVLSIRREVTERSFDEEIRRSVLEEAPPLKDNETCVLNEDLIVESVLFHYRPDVLTEDPGVFRQKYIDFTTDRKYAASTFALALQISESVPTFLYRFDYKTKTATFTDNREWVNVPQQFELPLVWGMPFWTGFSPQVAWNNADKKTSEAVMTLFGNFTKFSDPVRNKKAVRWEPFTADSPRIFIVDKNFNMSDTTTFDYKSVTFWNQYYPKIIDAANICCNVTEGASYIRPTALPFVLTPLLYACLINQPYA
ncbi:hypothetical protein AAG570_013067 [Ranatra chinensis]|uniref:Carboxylesterase type B domain-containing protein n=1 Tax=Ranatra chinensis TaxID=642074 RepID=A0ABD0YHL5_9HEMI